MEWQYISSKSNNLVVRISKLKDKKYRKAEGLFRFDGIKLFLEAVEKRVNIEYVFVMESAGATVKGAVKESGVDLSKVYLLSDEAFAKLTDEQSPEGVVTVCAYLENVVSTNDYRALADNVKGGTTLILESVRDAGNLGTIIRTAKAFSIDNLIISSDCADVYNPKTVRSAMGSLFRTRITTVNDVASFINAARENSRRVLAAELTDTALSLSDASLVSTDIVMIGNEGHGISPEISAMCDRSVYIPISHKTESLNASVAAAIFMWEQSK